MSNKKFSVRDYILEQMADEEQNPNMGVQQNAQNQNQPIQNNPAQPPQDQEESPAAQTKQLESGKGVFDDVVGATIGKIQFSRNTANGGEISIPIKGHSLPLKIRWLNNRIEVQKPDGMVVPLS